MSHTEAERYLHMKKILRATAVSIIGMTATGALLLAITALILGKTGNLPRAAIPIMMTVFGCITAFAGGFLASAALKEKGLLFGFLAALILLAVILLVTFLVFQENLTVASAGKGAAILLSGAIGGILGVNRKSRVKF